MASFLSRGLTWLQTQRQLHTTHPILIGYVKASAVSMLATVTSDNAESTQNRLTVQKQIFHFVVRRYDLAQANITLHRGLKIWYLYDTYELVYEGKDIYEYNDPDRNDIILKAVLVTDAEKLSPAYAITYRLTAVAGSYASSGNAVDLTYTP